MMVSIEDGSDLSLASRIESLGLLSSVENQLSESIPTPPESPSDNRGHEYASVIASGNANLTLGDVHYHIASSNHPRPPSEIKAFGLCLGQAPQIDTKCFVGRASELTAMNDILRPRNTQPMEQQRLILGGIGGMGKTQLAIAYARLYQNLYKSIFWLNSTSEATLKGSLQLVAQRILSASEYETLSLDQILARVREWLSNNGNKSWLLIFDNHDEPDQFDVTKYFPYTAHGCIIITTRLPDSLNGPQIRLQPLEDIEESLEILQKRSQRTGTKSDVFARRLAHRLGGLPLALATAGAYLHKSTLTFGRYLDEYEKRWNVDSRRPLQLQEYRDRTLYTTWNLSYVRLEAEDPDAAEMLKLLAYFDNQHLWYDLFQAGFDDSLPVWLQSSISDAFEFEGVIRKLVDYCFLEVQSTESYSVHSCIHDWISARLNSSINSWQYWYALGCIIASIRVLGGGALMRRFPEDILPINMGQLAHARFRRVAAHAARLANPRFQPVFDQPVPKDRLIQLVLVANLLQRQGHHDAAERVYQTTLARMQCDLGKDDPAIFTVYHGLGTLFYEKSEGSDFANAEKMYHKALVGREMALGVSNATTLNTVNNLGLLYLKQGKVEMAKLYLSRALAGKKIHVGIDDISTLIAFHSLGSLYARQGEIEQAKIMFAEALKGLEKQLDPDHGTILMILNSMANLYIETGDLEKAESLFQRALAGKYRTVGPYHKTTLATVQNLGICLEKQGKLGRARELYEQAIEGKRKVLGPDHPSTLLAEKRLRNLSQVSEPMTNNRSSSSQ